MKLIKVKKQDAKPSMRIKAAGNVFVEVYKDNKGYYYRIDVPGATDFVSKERFENQDKARLAGTTHAKKFISKVKGDQKKVDAGEAQKVQKLIKKAEKIYDDMENFQMEARRINTSKLEDEDEELLEDFENICEGIDEALNAMQASY